MRRNIRKEILKRDGNLSLDQETKENNRSNKQYLYKPKDFNTLVRDVDQDNRGNKLYVQRTLNSNWILPFTNPRD